MFETCGGGGGGLGGGCLGGAAALFPEEEDDGRSLMTATAEAGGVLTVVRGLRAAVAFDGG